MLQKQYSSTVIKMVTRVPVRRGSVVYIMGTLRGKESVSTNGIIMESFMENSRRAAFSHS